MVEYILKDGSKVSINETQICYMVANNAKSGDPEYGFATYFMANGQKLYAKKNA